MGYHECEACKGDAVRSRQAVLSRAERREGEGQQRRAVGVGCIR